MGSNKEGAQTYSSSLFLCKGETLSLSLRCRWRAPLPAATARAADRRSFFGSLSRRRSPDPIADRALPLAFLRAVFGLGKPSFCARGGRRCFLRSFLANPSFVVTDSLSRWLLSSARSLLGGVEWRDGCSFELKYR